MNTGASRTREHDAMLSGMGVKRLLRRAFAGMGYHVVGRDRLGVEVTADVWRLSGRDVRTVIDAGANCGQSALTFTAAFPRATIHSFEPVGATFAALQANVARRRCIVPHQMALGAVPGQARIALAASSGEASLAHITAAVNTELVTVTTLDAVAAALGLRRIDLLKMDVEGYEIPVLEGASGLLAAGAIRFITAECVYEPDPSGRHTLFFDLHARLSAAGYVFVAAYGEGFELAAGRALGNVLYALRAALPSSVPGRVRNIV